MDRQDHPVLVPPIGQGRRGVRARGRVDSGEATGLRSSAARRRAERCHQAAEGLYGHHASVQHVQLRRRRRGHPVQCRQCAVALSACGLHLPGRSKPGRRQGRPRRARRRRARGSGARRIQYQRCGAAEIAGRQVRGSRRQLQHRHPRIRQARGDAAEHGWFRGRLLQSGLNRLVAGLEEDRGLQDQARVPPLRALRGVLSRGPAPAEAQHAPVRQARRRSRRRTPRHL